MRRILALGAVLWGVGAARADTPATAIDAQLYKPALDPLGVFAVERAATLSQWDYGLKLSTGFALAPLKLAVENVGAAGETSNVLDYALTINLGLSFGLGDRLTFALDVPFSRQPLGPGYGNHGLFNGSDPDDEVRHQAGTGFYSVRPDQNVDPTETPVGDVRVGLKLRLTGKNADLGFALQLVGYAPFGDEDVFAGSASGTLEPKLILEKRLGQKGFLAVNLGARIREGTLAYTRHVTPDGFVRNDPTTHARIYLPVLYVGSEALVGVAARWSLGASLGVAGEVTGLIPITTSDDCTGSCKNGDLAVDLLGGLFIQLGSDTQLHLAAGLGVNPDAARAETVRGIVGISWTPATTSGMTGPRHDRDGDGIPDAEDLCPDEPEDKDGFQDEDGCPDPDNDLDGVPDEKDKCPNEPEDRDGFQDADGCPDTDDDGDGIPDVLDRCPHEAEDKDGFQDADGCPDPDNDGDGIPDEKDKCPNEPETFNGVEDADGCPDQAVQGGPKMAGDRIDLQGERIEFNGRTAQLTRPSQATLEAVANVMNQNLHVRIRVEVGVERTGTDKRSRDVDLKLTADRGREIQRVLLGKGVKPAQLDVAPLGSDRPIDAKNPKDPRVNRRVEFIRVTQ